jgi:hypothetical protein
MYGFGQWIRRVFGQHRDPGFRPVRAGELGFEGQAVDVVLHDEYSVELLTRAIGPTARLYAAYDAWRKVLVSAGRLADQYQNPATRDLVDQRWEAMASALLADMDRVRTMMHVAGYGDDLVTTPPATPDRELALPRDPATASGVTSNEPSHRSPGRVPGGSR